MDYILKYGGDIIGIFDDFIGAWEACDPRDDLSAYEIVVVEKRNVSNLMPFRAKTITISVVADEV